MGIPNISNLVIPNLELYVMKLCFFIGHRDAEEALYPLIVTEVEKHIAEYLSL